jgi:hypothetical protein
MNKINYRAENAQEFLACVLFMMAKGLKFSPDTTAPGLSAQEYSNSSRVRGFPIVGYNEDYNCIDAWDKSSQPTTPTLSAFIAAIADYRQPVFVQLNEKHKAKVSKDSIEVGCQTFPHSIVKDLADAIAKVKNG